MRSVKVKCISNPNRYDITIGLDYWGEESLNGLFITNDKGLLSWYPMRLFRLIMVVE